MQRDLVYVLGVGVDRVDRAAALRRMCGLIEAGRAERAAGRPSPLAQVVTANSEIIMAASQDAEMGRILAAASLVVADGAGVVWAARLLGKPLLERVAGIDLTREVLKACAVNHWRPFLLGAAPGVAEAALADLQKDIPALEAAGWRHGYFSLPEDEAVVEAINAARADLLLVGLGAPRQEKWIAAHRDKLQVPVAVGVGGSFDIWAGRMARAPRWMREIGLEWAYRLLRQPQRIGRMSVLPRFAARILWTKWKGDQREGN